MLSAGSLLIDVGRFGVTQPCRHMRHVLIPDGPGFVSEKACGRNVVVIGLDAQGVKLFALPDAYSMGFARSFHGTNLRQQCTVKTLPPGNDGIAESTIAALRKYAADGFR
jgi:hypothetical protein